MTENEVRVLMGKVQEMLVAQAEIRGDIKQIADENDKADALHVDHEKRIRSVEKAVWQAAGICTFLGSGLGAAVVTLLQR